MRWNGVFDGGRERIDSDRNGTNGASETERGVDEAQASESWSFEFGQFLELHGEHQSCLRLCDARVQLLKPLVARINDE